MYIKEITIEGFKSYAQRTNLRNFSRSFNAITGLNGSGKSNILDSICFVLGISNLSQVRVHNLQQLVFNMGQTGIKKASVTIVFDNTDRNNSPVGYVDHEQITVTRQVVIGGRNKYIINGRTVLKERVTNLFRSVQLNVDNPHFLIMQGHITKVVKMKPKEILNMIEETAGTSMFETKKEKALKDIKRKDNKLTEIQSIIDDSIAPSLERRKKEQEKFVEWSRNNEKAEELKKVKIAFDVFRLSIEYKNRKKEVVEVERIEKEIKESISRKKKKIKELEEKIKEVKNSDESKELNENVEKLKSKVKKIEKKLIIEQQSLSDSNSGLNDLEQEKAQIEKRIMENSEEAEKLTNQIEQHERELSQKQEHMEQLINKQGLYQKKLEGSTSAEQIANDSFSSQNQLMKAKKNVIRIQSEIKSCLMKLEHENEEKKKILESKEKYLREFNKMKLESKQFSEELKKMEEHLSKKSDNFENSEYNSFVSRKREEENKMNQLVTKKRAAGSKLGVLGLYYNPNNPYDRNFHHHGLLGNLFRVKDRKYHKAIETIAKGRLYFHVVDTDEEGSKLMKQSNRRINIIPLNKIVGYSIDNGKIQMAKRTANAIPALSVLEFDNKFEAAMKFVFGGCFIANNLDDAEKVAYNRNIATRCVDLSGGDMSPSGTLSGGESRNEKQTVLQIIEIEETTREISKIQNSLRNIDNKLVSLEQSRSDLEKLETEVKQLKRRKKQSDQDVKESRYQQMMNRLEYLEKSFSKLSEKQKDFEKELEISVNRRNDLEKQVKLLTSSSFTAKELEKELKATKNEVSKAKKEHQKCKENTHKLKYKKEHHEETNSTLFEEVENCKKSIISIKEKSNITNSEVTKFLEQKKLWSSKLNELVIEQDSRSQKSTSFREKIGELERSLTNDNLNLEKIESRSSKVSKNSTDIKSKISNFRKNNSWIEDEEEMFGKKNTEYDFSKERMEVVLKQLGELEAHQRKLKLHVNRKSMLNYEQQKSEYEKLVKRKEMVERDKEKIKNSIDTLDKSKREVILNTWKSVGKDFGRVFQQLLPGTNAKLDAVEGDYLNGLEIKVAFGGKWKESLSELSGGQRSLLALSLILSLLLYRPAPMYILDEIDAALDPSHTRNIGSLLKNEFSNSQFIVVSLKEGMFTNAEVLFTTNFHKGQSMVKRTEGSHESDDERKMEDDSESETEDESDTEDEFSEEEDSGSIKTLDFPSAIKRKRVL